VTVGSSAHASPTDVPEPPAALLSGLEPNFQP
jgi:hypothetical protein